jgi:2'-5' RNA ligase
MADRIRTFVAVELDDELRRSLIGLQEAVKTGLQVMASDRRLDRSARVQWTRPESLHLTLKFLGDIDPAQVEPIQHALTERVSPLARFSVDVEGWGAFPDARAPRVLWVGLKSQHVRDPLLELAAAVEQALMPLGFPTEDKPFNPHLTLARIKDGSRSIGHALRSAGRVSTIGRIGTLSVQAITFIKSELRPSGSLYTRLFTVPLCGRESN